jgi:hypothetical protein
VSFKQSSLAFTAREHSVYHSMCKGQIGRVYRFARVAASVPFHRYETRGTRSPPSSLSPLPSPDPPSGDPLTLRFARRLSPTRRLFNLARMRFFNSASIRLTPSAALSKGSAMVTWLPLAGDSRESFSLSRRRTMLRSSRPPPPPHPPTQQRSRSQSTRDHRRQSACSDSARYCAVHSD